MHYSLAANSVYLTAIINFANAQSFGPESVGGGPGYIGGTGIDQEFFALSGRKPNDTTTALFQGPGIGPDDHTWAWRVNITNIPLPDSGNMYATNTQYDLQWPGDGELNSYLDAEFDECTGGCTRTPLCLVNMAIDLPSNITRRYFDGSRGNCSNVLGAECERSLRSALAGDCGGPGGGSLKGCSDSLDVGQLSSFSFSMSSSWLYHIRPS